MGRLMAIDLGSKRIGLAISDPLRIIAQPLRTIDAQPQLGLARRLRDVAEAEGCDELVVGWPRLMDGGRGPEAEFARRLADTLRADTGWPVHLVDERLTSVQAERSMLAAGLSRARRKQLSDPIAATLILQGFLGRISGG